MTVVGFSKQRQAVSAVLLFTIVFWPAAVFAQDAEVEVRSGFLADSLKIGERTGFYLSARYPSQSNILFPDSSHGFAPFEYEAKEYFITQTQNGISRDSTIYYLTTFEVDRIQHLSLPVYIVQESDCTIVHSPPDSVLITQFVAQVPDTVSTPELPLRENVAYEKVRYNLNVILLLAVLTILIALALVIWAVFGRRITQYFKLRKLQKAHNAFLERYNALLVPLQSGFSLPATESALATWKKYMEELESKPYTKLTTRETQRLIRQPAVTQDLSHIDRAIYGNDTSVIAPLENLRRFADEQFQQKVKEVQHGQ